MEDYTHHYIQGDHAPAVVHLPTPISRYHRQQAGSPSDWRQYQFKDFISRTPSRIVSVIGPITALDTLNSTLSAGGCVQDTITTHQFAVYTPLIIAIEHIRIVNPQIPMDRISELDLIQLQCEPWFTDFAKQFMKKHYLEQNFDCTQFVDPSSLSAARMVLILDALAVSQRLPKIDLGIVTLRNGHHPTAVIHPEASREHALTAWILADLSSGSPKYCGIGAVSFQKPFSQQQEPVASENEGEVEDSSENEPAEVSTPSNHNKDGSSTRKTATRVTEQQVPLAAGLTAQDILSNHLDKLQYNNILKVALSHSNKDISDAATDNLKGGATGVVKRINTGIRWLEQKYDIEKGVLRTAFDRARKANGVSVRGKDEVPETKLAEFQEKIDIALSWVKKGGPEPTSTSFEDPDVINQHAYATPASDITTHHHLQGPDIALDPSNGPQVNDDNATHDQDAELNWQEINAFVDDFDESLLANCFEGGFL